MLLIVGLGNPGGDYARHRHNVGFMAADAIHRRHAFGVWRKRFSAELSEGVLAGEKTMLLKPTTYMNDSGRAVGEAAHFYKLSPSDIVAIHDELDLPPGKVRVKTGGGDGGHNGLRSLTAHLGADYRRLRIGIGHPGHKDAVTGHVLRDFAKADAAWLEPLLEAIAAAAPLLAEGRDDAFATRIHLAAAPATKPSGGRRKALAAPAQPDPEPTESLSEPAKAKSESASVIRRDGPLGRGLRRLFGREP